MNIFLVQEYCEVHTLMGRVELSTFFVTNDVADSDVIIADVDFFGGIDMAIKMASRLNRADRERLEEILDTEEEFISFEEECSAFDDYE